MDEAEAIQAYVQQQAGENCDVILGMGHDPSLEDRIGVTVIATGFTHKELSAEVQMKRPEPEKILVSLRSEKPETDFLPSATEKEQESKAEINPLEPRLVDNSTEQEPLVFNPQPAFPAWAQPINKPQEENPGGIINPTNDADDYKQQLNHIQLVIKSEAEQKNEQEIIIGEHKLTPAEIAERNAFEEQKKALEERADKLRRMSFNINGNESSDEMENVPAYVRKNLEIDNTVASAAQFYSNYSIGKKDEQSSASIQTINTFLDGKKPD
jgi:cell division protein FtsZ